MARWGIAGIALDLDNTIVPWHTDELIEGAQAWVRSVRDAGIRVCLLTNNYGSQATNVSRTLGVPIVKGALKPLPAAFARSLRCLETSASKGLAIGDQLFTDVLGAKLVGMRAIVVKPVAAREFPTTRVLRFFERPLMSRLRRSGTHGS